MMKKFKKRMGKIKKSIRAFTLPELLVTVAIIATVGTVGFFYLYNFKQVNALDQAAQSTVAAIRYAQNQAIAGDRGEKWGVHVEKDENGQDYFTIYFGATYATGTVISRSPYASGIAVKATEDVNFTQLCGTIPAEKTIVLQLASDSLVNRILTVDFIGTVTISSNIPKWTITSLTSPGEVSGNFSADVGSDDLSRISYWRGYMTYGVEFLNCLNVDCANRTTTTIEIITTIAQNAIAIGQDGFGRVAYEHVTDGLKFARCTNSDCTSKNITTIENISNPVGISVAIGLDGFPRIAYSYSSTAFFRFVRCLNADCASTNITEVESGPGWHPSLAIGSDGFARMSYYDPNNSDLKFVHCFDADCVTKNITAVDTIGSVGGFTSLVLDGNRYGQIAYYDDNVSPSKIKFARCLDIDCTAKNIAVIDSALTGVHFNEHPNSIAMGKDGFPRITYRSGTDGNGAIQFVECLNADCSSKNIESPHSSSSGNGSAYSFLDIDSSGLARIVYSDTMDYTVKVAKKNW